ncbi:hypothetical protein Ppro_1496 [Pelobacter propionicus DSM 2379]|uniref:Uncharacterized protein n=1 Tax=Pelobacter propionicus (strain DSM 2379 / NBRC 103807 / OttBd1) TaxID=338966 RepID=A1AP42_PELPD|nr:hypothetical protein Ppro_1496 [Pelobacter propionicus DSM 2379]
MAWHSTPNHDQQERHRNDSTVPTSIFSPDSNNFHTSLARDCREGPHHNSNSIQVKKTNNFILIQKHRVLRFCCKQPKPGGVMQSTLRLRNGAGTCEWWELSGEGN